MPAGIHLAREGVRVRFIRDAAEAERVVGQIASISDGPIGIDIEAARLQAFAGHPRAGQVTALADS